MVPRDIAAQIIRQLKTQGQTRTQMLGLFGRQQLATRRQRATANNKQQSTRNMQGLAAMMPRPNPLPTGSPRRAAHFLPLHHHGLALHLRHWPCTSCHASGHTPVARNKCRYCRKPDPIAQSRHHNGKGWQRLSQTMTMLKPSPLELLPKPSPHKDGSHRSSPVPTSSSSS